MTCPLYIHHICPRYEEGKCRDWQSCPEYRDFIVAVEGWIGASWKDMVEKSGEAGSDV